ncbi:hypothetical protein NVP1170O_056 [Vibrio phage 1.170.O._10N.261.52.C3]|nr:hypothetical protein NVP1170O_056 [Vibrio phage 1.170.O._10N.261.52.C3]
MGLQIPSLDPSLTLGLDDETVLRQDGKDVRIQLQLAAILSWAVRWDKQFIGLHTSGITFNDPDEFTVFEGKTYFIKDTSNLPYTSNTNNPSTDSNLTTTVRAKSNHVHDWADVIYPVGASYITFESHNPADFLGGTWELVTGDASLALGDGTTQNTTISGENNPLVPLPEHSHGSGNLFTQEAGNHNHTVDTANSGEFFQYEGGGGNPGVVIPKSTQKTSSSAGNHSHTISGSTANTGTNGVTLDVRGAQLKVNVWRRVA